MPGSFSTRSRPTPSRPMPACASTAFNGCGAPRTRSTGKKPGRCCSMRRASPTFCSISTIGGSSGASVAAARSMTGTRKSPTRSRPSTGSYPATTIIEAEFLAGWIALRFLNDPNFALKHFLSLRRVATSSKSIALGEYWLGRTGARTRRSRLGHGPFLQRGQVPAIFLRAARPAGARRQAGASPDHQDARADRGRHKELPRPRRACARWASPAPRASTARCRNSSWRSRAS